MLTVFNRDTNEGKTYITQKDSIDLLYASKAEDFNTWFSSNSYELERYLKDRQQYIGDVFTKAYLNIYENILYRGTDMMNYKGFFLSAYYRIMLNGNVYQNRFLELTPYNEKSENDSEYYKELDEENRSLEKKIFEYVYSFYTLQEYEIFKMYINMQHDGCRFSIESLAQIINKKYWSVFRIVYKIKNSIVENYDKIKSGEIYHMNNENPVKQLDKSYLFCRDYETLWNLRIKASYTIICIVDIKGSKYVANMTPNGEIFAGGDCYSDFEGVSKSVFIKQCEELKVEYIKPNYPETVQTKLF